MTKEVHTQPDLFGGETTVSTAVERPPVVRTDEQRRRLSEDRFAKKFSVTSLFAELALPEIAAEDDDENEGRANPELDARLRVSNADISACSDRALEGFVFELHRACIEVNLAYLVSEDEKPRVLQEKGFILQWAFCDDIVGGRAQSQIPFSFHNCCMASGVNPDEFRAQLLQMDVVRDLLVRLRLVQAEKLPRQRQKVFYADICTLTDSVPEHPVYIAGV